MFKIVKEWGESGNFNVLDTEFETLEVNLKWDGCVNIYHGHNGVNPSIATEDEREHIDYIHICDLDDFIKKLQEIQRLGKERFGNEYW